MLFAPLRPALAQTSDGELDRPASPASPASRVQLDADIEVQVAAGVLTVRDAGGDLFRARLESWSPVTELGTEVANAGVRLFSWNYPHLQGIAFADISFELPDAAQPALQLELAEDFELVTHRLRPHDGMGGHGQISVSAWQRVFDEAGSRSYLAIVRLDGGRLTVRGDNLYSFDATRQGESVQLPLAIIRADTAPELRARMGQAVLTFNGAGERENPDEWWRVPTLCGLCQQQQVSEVELYLQDRDDSLLLHVRTRVQYEGHAMAAAEGMRIEGLALGPWLIREQGDEAWFSIPLEEPLSEALIAVAMSGDARVEARLSTGETREVATIRLHLDPAFEERIYSQEKIGRASCRERV